MLLKIVLLLSILLPENPLPDMVIIKDGLLINLCLNDKNMLNS